MNFFSLFLKNKYTQANVTLYTKDKDQTAASTNTKSNYTQSTNKKN